jgi:hypothetical protein
VKKESEGVSTFVFKSGPNKIELWQLQALESDSQVYRQKEREFIISSVEDIVSEIAFAEGRVCRLE